MLKITQKYESEVQEVLLITSFGSKTKKCSDHCIKLNEWSYSCSSYLYLQGRTHFTPFLKIVYIEEVTL
jgi:hypothetical protein